MYFTKKEEAFDNDLPFNILMERTSDLGNEEPLSMLVQQMHDQILSINPYSGNIDQYLFSFHDPSSAELKIEDKAKTANQQKSSTLTSPFNNQVSQSPAKFRTLRSGKCQTPKPLSINNRSLNKIVMKNGLQYYAYTLHRYFKQQKYLSSAEEEIMLQILRKYPSVNNFNELFKKDGNIRIRLSQFLQTTNLWRIILTSRFRNYQAKLIMKKVGLRICKRFIHSQLDELGNITEAK